MDIVNPAIETYLRALRPPADPVVAEMERRAEQRGFPIVGPEVGRLLAILTRATAARRVLELGSGFGYSAWWFAGALPPGGAGEVICTDADAAHRDEALELLGEAGLAGRVRFLVGDALEIARGLQGPFDIVFNDVDKHAYPATLPLAASLLRTGGLFITDNTLWKGRVTEPRADDPDTQGVLELNRALADHPQLDAVILPLRDGLTVAVKR